MKKKKILSALLAGTLLLTHPVALLAEDIKSEESPESEEPTSVQEIVFSDIDNHWAYDAILRFSKAGIVQGSMNQFRPDDSLTRGEMAVILDRLMQYQTVSEELFSDLTADAWYTPSIQKLRAANVMLGDENHMALPENCITREEAVVLIARTFHMETNAEENDFLDAEMISDWAAPYVNAMTNAGYLQGDENHFFRPQEPITRAEVVTVLHKMITAFCYDSGTYNYLEFQGLADYVIIAANDVKILNFDIGGIILLTEGVDFESIRLQGVNHYGKVYQYTEEGFVRRLKAATRIVAIDETIPVCTHDPELYSMDECGIMSYNDPDVSCYLGVDVSSWQYDIDWNTLREEGVYFAFIRAGYRGYESGALNTDSNFEKNIQGALDAGIKVGVYFFSQALNAEEAEEEALYVLNLIQGYDITFPVVFDWELVSSSTARTNGMETEALCEAANAFCHTVEQAGYIPMIYSNQSVSLLYYDLSRIQAYDFWYAEYKEKPTYYYDYDIWQYGATAHLQGVSHANVDVNISFVDYSARANT